MTRETEILQFLHYNPDSSRSKIAGGLSESISDSTVTRLISDALNSGSIVAIGKGRGVKYRLSPQSYITMPLDLDTYFSREMDERQVQTGFNSDFNS